MTTVHVGHAWRAFPRVLLGVSLALSAAAAGCGGDPGRPAAAASPAATGATSAPPPVPPAPSPSPSPSPAPSPSPVARPTTAAAPPRHYVFPIVGTRSDYQRIHDLYPATDIFAACGASVRAVTDGTVMEVSRVDRFDPANSQGPDRGGLFVALRGDDGVRYYGAHLSALEPGIDAGVRVAAGTPIGRVGHTGNANGICHLHFAISPPCGVGDWWTRRGVVWPWRYLDAWRTKQDDLSPAPEVRAWQAAHGCPQTVPPGVS